MDCRLLAEAAEVPGALASTHRCSLTYSLDPPPPSPLCLLPPDTHLSCPLRLDGLPRGLPLLAPCLSFPFKHQSDHPRVPQETP